MDQIRQGDVLLIEVSQIPKTATDREKGCVLAYGESTGHSHQVKNGGEIVVDVNDLGRRYLKVLNKTSLDHEEHYWALLHRGKKFQIRIQKEYTPAVIRNVVD